MLKKLMLAASALALSACATTPAAPPEPAFDYTGPALWKFGDEDTTVYLFGTIHVLPEGLDWLDPTVANAIASSDEYVSEIDTSLIPDYDPASGAPPPPEIMQIAQMQMSLAQLQTGGTLRDLMNDEDRAEYEAALASLDLPAAALDQFEPWFASMTMLQLALPKAGYDPKDGVELMLDPLIEGKNRTAFETIEMQMQFFDSLPMESQLIMLDQGAESLVDLSEMDEQFQQMVSEWVEGDADGLASVINDNLDDDPAVYDVLLTQRNIRWADWLVERLDRPGTVFVAVGAGHLGGANSVQDLLAERGVETERVAY